MQYNVLSTWAFTFEKCSELSLVESNAEVVAKIYWEQESKKNYKKYIFETKTLKNFKKLNKCRLLLVVKLLSLDANDL